MSDELIHNRITALAKKYPLKIAATDEAGSFSYGEFNARADGIAAKLARLGIAAGNVTAVYLPYTKDFAVSAVAVWKVGGIFMPLDEEYPAQRLEYMMTNSEAQALITCKDLWTAKNFDYSDEQIIFLDDISEADDFKCAADLTSSSPAMLLYTSGTTGKPKGVLHTHDILSHFLDWIDESVAVNSDSRTAILTRFTFVGTVMFMFGTLHSGGSIHFAPRSARLDIEFLYKFFRQESISHAFIPSGLATMLAEDYDIAGINVFAAGETLRNFKPHSKNICLWNSYGSTETGGIMLNKIMGDENPISIGKPTTGTEIILVDENLEQAQCGELLVSSPHMSKSYFKLPELTAEKWIELDGRKFYRTGDRAKRDTAGNYCLLGRTDNLVKLRGFRIETGEVEAQISNAIRQMNRSDVKAVVVTLKNIHNTDYLVCYYESKNKLDTDAVKKKISQYLADYMIPEIFVRLDSMPRNANGKILRKELPLPKRQTSRADFLYSEVLTRVIWAAQDVIGNVTAYPSDNFTELGGSSLTAMKFSTVLRAQGIKVSTAQILQLNQLQKIVDAATVDYSKLWTAEQYVAIEKDFSSRGEHIEKVLPLTTEQDELFFQQIFQPDQSTCREVYMIELDGLIAEDDLRLALDDAAQVNEKFRAAVVFHHTPVIQQVITDRKIPLEIVNVVAPDLHQLQSFRRQLLNLPVDPQRNSLLQVICVQSGGQSFIFVLAFCILFTRNDLFKYCADVLKILTQKYPNDLSIRQWQEIFKDEVADSKPPSAENKTAFKQRAHAKINIPPEIYVYSRNIEPQMVFVHTGNSSGEVYYRLGDRIKNFISFAVIEPFNLYHPNEATYGIKNIAARYLQTLKRHQPKGPYIIGGWCYGGVVAHEMACQLEQAGEVVQHLFMLDSHAITDEKIRKLTKTMFGETNREYFETSSLFQDLREGGMLEAVINNYFHVAQDIAAHTPSYFHGDVTYFKPDELPSGQSEKSLAYWNKMMEFEAGGFENFCNREKLKIIHTPHEHDLMMDDPSLDIIVPEIYRVVVGK